MAKSSGIGHNDCPCQREYARNPGIRIKKTEKEKQAIENLRLALNKTNEQEIYDLFYEFEGKKLMRAKWRMHWIN